MRSNGDSSTPPALPNRSAREPQPPLRAEPRQRASSRACAGSLCVALPLAPPTLTLLPRSAPLRHEETAVAPSSPALALLPPLPPFALHLSRRLPFVSRSHSHRSLSHCALALAHCGTRKLPLSSRVQLSRCRPLRLLAPHRAHPSPLLSQDPARTSRCTLAPSHRSARELLPPALALHKRAGPITQRFPTAHSQPPLLCRPVSLLALAL